MIEALGQSEAFVAFQEQLSRVAKVDRPVLILGERGTGKELAAQRLHYLSGRWERELVALNCAALSSTLIESELFGYEAGAFTGARRSRAGRFETADGGTLFLDELGNLPLTVQEKVLRVVEYGSFERVGASEPTRVDVRLIGATNADLPALAESGKFMRDLLDRLSFEVLHLPPLRKRLEDIELLSHHFASRMALELGREEAPVFSAGAKRSLLDYPWPGNIRELKNVVERAVYRCDGNRIEEIVFNPFENNNLEVFYSSPNPSASSYRGHSPMEGEASESPGEHSHPEGESLGQGKEAWDENEKKGSVPSTNLPERIRCLELQAVRQALRSNRYNQRKAATALGLTYHQFRGLYRKHQATLQADEEPLK